VKKSLAIQAGPPACVLVYRKWVLRDSRFGKSRAWANPWERLHGQHLFWLGRISFNDRQEYPDVEGWLPDSSRIWPYGASKRGLPRPRQCKKLGVGEEVLLSRI